MQLSVLIMAGGKGERFWPRSRRNFPKQFLSLTNDGKTMIQHTVERVKNLVCADNIFITTNEDYLELVQKQLPEIPKENILCEPVSRNTAPSIGYAAMKMREKLGEAIMIVLPSDHLIKYNSIFLDTIRDASGVAEETESLVTIGITPTYPETGYGYIQFDPQGVIEGTCRAYPVKKIVEKPDLERAKSFLQSGEYLWNSGMFIWKISTIIENIRKFLPSIYDGLCVLEKSAGTSDEDATFRREYAAFPSISVDYGIMERAELIYVLPGTFGWDDVGNWLALERINQTNDYGNVVEGNAICVETRDCIIEGGEKLIAAVGLENIIIVDTKDAILICNKDHSQDVKLVLENLKICNRTEYI